MNPKITEGDFLVNCLHGQAFSPSPEMLAVPGVTWANDDRHVWYVASKDQKQVACCGMFVVNRVARFKTDVVLPDYRGQGLYSLLFSMRLAYAKTKADQATTFSNQQSRHMYEKAGFKPAGEESERGVLYMRLVFDKPPKQW
jgi:GNAT superfamily N-acetyltransferase